MGPRIVSISTHAGYRPPPRRMIPIIVPLYPPKSSGLVAGHRKSTATTGSYKKRVSLLPRTVLNINAQCAASNLSPRSPRSPHTPSSPRSPRPSFPRCSRAAQVSSAYSLRRHVSRTSSKQQNSMSVSVNTRETLYIPITTVPLLDNLPSGGLSFGALIRDYHDRTNTSWRTRLVESCQPFHCGLAHRRR